jgi:quercetin dioxygenase-like cupin family protein
MYIFDIDAVRRAIETMDSNGKEFMRVESMSVGVYRLKAGARDDQKPHTEDELYYVTKGVARFQTGETIQDVKTGSVIYVEANRDHRFVDITEDLEVLVVFTPAEGSNAPRA